MTDPTDRDALTSHWWADAAASSTPAEFRASVARLEDHIRGLDTRDEAELDTRQEREL